MNSGAQVSFLRPGRPQNYAVVLLEVKKRQQAKAAIQRPHSYNFGTTINPLMP
jgi:hypothetical protein